MKNTDWMKAFMIIGDLGATKEEKESLADRVAYKQRIVWATMRSMQKDWMPPANWDTLTDEVKMERLEELQKMDLS